MYNIEKIIHLLGKAVPLDREHYVLSDEDGLHLFSKREDLVAYIGGITEALEDFRYEYYLDEDYKSWHHL